MASASDSSFASRFEINRAIAHGGKRGCVIVAGRERVLGGAMGRLAARSEGRPGCGVQRRSLAHDVIDDGNGQAELPGGGFITDLAVFLNHVRRP